MINSPDFWLSDGSLSNYTKRLFFYFNQPFIVVNGKTSVKMVLEEFKLINDSNKKDKYLLVKQELKTYLTGQWIFPLHVV